MDENKFKQQYKPAACSRAPWASVIEPGQRDAVMRQIRLECIQIYGYSMDTCTLKSVCIGKQCLGRELPFKSPTAKPYLEKMKKLGLIKNNKYYVNTCETCPIKNTCSKLCPEMNDYLNRHQNKQPELVYRDSMENFSSDASGSLVLPSEMKGLILPWDCLKTSKRRIVELRLNSRKDFLSIAKECGLYNEAPAKYQFYSALTKLAEYAIVREFIKEKGSNLTLNQMEILKAKYIENKSVAEIAKYKEVNKSVIYQTIKNIFNKYDVKWPVYVKKIKGKVVYEIPEVLQ